MEKQINPRDPLTTLLGWSFPFSAIVRCDNPATLLLSGSSHLLSDIVLARTHPIDGGEAGPTSAHD